MHRLRVLLLALAVAGCGGDTAKLDLTLPPTETNVTGTFVLSLANGQALPFQAIVTNTEIWNLTADRIVLAPNGTWTDTTAYNITSRDDGSQSTRLTASAGTWAIANNQINFIMTVGGTVTFEGSVVQNSLSVNFSGHRYLYLR